MKRGTTICTDGSSFVVNSLTILRSQTKKKTIIINCMDLLISVLNMHNCICNMTITAYINNACYRYYSKTIKEIDLKLKTDAFSLLKKNQSKYVNDLKCPISSYSLFH